MNSLSNANTSPANFNLSLITLSMGLQNLSDVAQNGTDGDEDRSAARYMEKYYSLALLAFGTIGNVLSFAVLSRKAFRVTAVSVYLRFLSLSDIGALYTGAMYFTAKSLFDVNVRHQSLMSCKFHRWLSFTFCDTSSWALVLVSSARLISIMWPMKRLITRKRAYIAIVITVVICLCANIPIFIMYGDVYVPAQNRTKLCIPISKSWDDFYTYVFGWIVLLKFAFLPAVLLIILNTALVVSVSRSGKAVDKIESHSENGKSSMGKFARFWKRNTKRTTGRGIPNDDDKTLATSVSEADSAETGTGRVGSGVAQQFNKIMSFLKFKGVSQTSGDSDGDVWGSDDKKLVSIETRSAKSEKHPGKNAETGAGGGSGSQNFPGKTTSNNEVSNNEETAQSPASPSNVKLTNKNFEEITDDGEDVTRNHVGKNDLTITNDLSKSNRNSFRNANNFSDGRCEDKIVNNNYNINVHVDSSKSQSVTDTRERITDTRGSVTDSRERVTGHDNPAFLSGDENALKDNETPESSVKTNQSCHSDNNHETIAAVAGDEAAEVSTTVDITLDDDLSSTENNNVDHPTHATRPNVPNNRDTEKHVNPTKPSNGHTGSDHRNVQKRPTGASAVRTRVTSASKSNASQGSSQNKSKSLTGTLLVINTVFLVCNAPITIYLSGKTYLFPAGFPPSKELFLTTANFMMYTNNAINFVFYCVTGSRFRTELILMFKDLFQAVRDLVRRMCN